MRSDEWASNHKVQAIKGQSGKSGKGAAKVNVLIWGDLLSCDASRNSNRKVRLRRQESAEAIVPSVVSYRREGLNGKRVLSMTFVERALKADCLE